MCVWRGGGEGVDNYRLPHQRNARSYSSVKAYVYMFVYINIDIDEEQRKEGETTNRNAYAVYSSHKKASMNFLSAKC